MSERREERRENRKERREERRENRKERREERKKKRDYKKEYKRDHSSKSAKKDRAGRNAANAIVKPGPGKDAHHKNGNPRDNRPSNLVAMSSSKNRGIKTKAALKQALKKKK